MTAIKPDILAKWQNRKTTKASDRIIQSILYVAAHCKWYKNLIINKQFSSKLQIKRPFEYRSNCWGVRIMGKWSQKSVRNCYSYSNCQKLIEQALLTKTATSEYSTFIKSVNYNSQAWTSEDHRHMSWGRGMKGLHAPWIEQSKFLGQLLHFSGRNQQPKMKKTQNSFKEGER